MPPRLAPLAALLLVAGLAAPARADDGGAPLAPADEIRALQTEIARDVAVLATGACDAACQALASMKRAADRLCALDAGPGCVEARARVRDAERHVQASCGACQPPAGVVPSVVVAKPEVVMEKQPAEPAKPAPPPAAEAVMAAPPHGGCAGCVVGGEGGATGAGLIAAVGAVAAWARRRRRRRGGAGLA